MLTAARDKWNNTIVCYYTNWSQYRTNAKFFPEDIDPSLCTNLIFAFAEIVEVNDTWGIGSTEWNDLDTDWSDGMYTRFNELKVSNPELKVSDQPFVNDQIVPSHEYIY